MKERVILFAFDSEEDIKVKMTWLTKFLKKENISESGLTYQIPEVTIRCNDRQWKEIKFKLDLHKNWV